MQTLEGGGVRSSKHKAGAQTRRVRKVVNWLTFAFFGLAVAGWAQTPDVDAGKASKPWTATTESLDSAAGSPTRTVASHTQNGNRTVDKQSVEVLRSGRFEPYQDIESESVQVNDTTVRKVVRTFTRDADGQRILFQVTEEERQTLSGGGVKVVRSTSNPDANGRPQVVQREVQNTKKISPTVEETATTVFLPSINGDLAPAMLVQERQEHISDHTVQFRKSTLLPDGAGNWQVEEVRKGTITEDGKNRTSEERVSRRDPEGRLVEVSRTAGKDLQGASGEKRSTVEDYSTEVPGSASDGSLHLVQRVTTVRNDRPNGGQSTRQQVEQLNAGDLGASLQVTIESTDAKNPVAFGTQETRTIQVRDANGNLNAISVDMTKSDRTPTVQVQIAPSEKPK
jgi:hypothetical protein